MTGKDFVKEYIKTHSAEALSLLETLGRIPAPSHHEDKRAQFCLNWFKNQGAEEAWIDEAKNVICPVNCSKYEDIVVFMAHTDIVFPDREELPMKKEGNKLFAPGIGDDTANLVHLLIGAKYFLNQKVPTTKALLFVANSCEEGLGNLKGCKAIFDHFGHRIKEFYSFDGYLSHCTSTPVGSHRYRITAKAEGGHSYHDFGKENPIVTMAALIQDLSRIELPEGEKTTFNIGRIEGGTTVNSIPQEAAILYEYRSPSQKNLTYMKQAFDRIVSRRKSGGKQIIVDKLGIRPGKGDIDETFLKEWTEKNIRIIEQYCTGEIIHEPSSTDANIPLSRGIPGNTIGTIAGGGAHTREEWIDMDSIPQGLGIAFELMLQYLRE